MAFDRADFYDAELRRHDVHFQAALKIGARDCVLDIGCGAGQSTREAARAAVGGSVLGVDVSEELLEIARRRSEDEGLRNVAFEKGDAQVEEFPASYFDLCISRFGVMFFTDPVAALTNIGRGMRPGARLVFMVWQGRERNEWATAIPGALALGDGQSLYAPPAFSLGDRAVTTRILSTAGIGSIDFAEVHEPVFYGPNIDTAHEAIVGLFLDRATPAGADAAADEALQQRLRALLSAHLTADGVLFDSHAWIVTARWPNAHPMDR